jgi:hypothetical protein
MKKVVTKKVHIAGEERQTYTFDEIGVIRCFNDAAIDMLIEKMQHPKQSIGFYRTIRLPLLNNNKKALEAVIKLIDEHCKKDHLHFSSCGIGKDFDNKKALWILFFWDNSKETRKCKSKLIKHKYKGKLPQRDI